MYLRLSRVCQLPIYGVCAGGWIRFLAPYISIKKVFCFLLGPLVNGPNTANSYQGTILRKILRTYLLLLL